MSKVCVSQKGVVLYLALATLLIVVILANIILTIISTQSRLTHHQISRIQALYAGKAGMAYVLEKLRDGSWRVGTNCTTASGGCDLSDPLFPVSIKQPVKIFITPFGSGSCTASPGNSACIKIDTNYTYTP